MKEQHANELWIRFLDGELTARERAALKQLLSADLGRRDRFIDDVQMDGMLRTLDHIDATADDFVAQVAGRLDEMDAEVEAFPLASEPAEGAVSPPAPPPVPPPVETEAADVETRSVSEGTKNLSENRRGLAHFAESSEQNVPVPLSSEGFRIGSKAVDPPLATPARLRKNALALAIGVAAMILVALVGAIVLVTTRDADRVAEDTDKNDPQSVIGSQPDGDHDEIVIERPDSQVVEQPLSKPGNNLPNHDENRAPQIVDRPRNPKPDERDVAETNAADFPSKPDREDSPRPTPDRIPQNPLEDFGVLARLTKSVEAKWQSEPPTELTSKPLSLKSGIVEIMMNDGVALTILGPAEFELDSNDHVLLTRGRLNALVPGQATGFTVVTPSSHVVDLGTEFDVSVDEHGETAVRVHQGEVQLASLPSAGSEPVKWKLRQGQFKTLRRDGVSYDFYLATNLDRSARGTVRVNGIVFAVMDRKDLDAARTKVTEGLAQIRKGLAKPRGRTYGGLVDLDGDPTEFGNSTQLMSAWRRTNDYFDNAGRMLDRSGVFRGSININGVQIDFDSTRGKTDPTELLRKMGIGTAPGGFGNLRELMKMQEEVMKRFREGGGGSDVRGPGNNSRNAD